MEYQSREVAKSGLFFCFVLARRYMLCRVRVETRCGAVMKRRERLRRLPGWTALGVLC